MTFTRVLGGKNGVGTWEDREVPWLLVGASAEFVGCSRATNAMVQ